MALLFDGIDDRAMSASIAAIPLVQPFTLGAVIVVNTLGGNQVIAQTSSANPFLPWRFLVIASGAPRLSPGNATAGFTLTAGETVFVAVASLDSTTHRFFAYRYAARSELTSLQATAVAPGSTSSPRLKIGCQSTDETDTAFSSFFAGTMTWLGIWDRYLGSVGDGYDQLRALAQLGPLAVGDPAFLADFREGQGSVVRDRSGNGNHANMANFPASPWQPEGLGGAWWARRTRLAQKKYNPLGDVMPTSVRNLTPARSIQLLTPSRSVVKL